MRVTKTLIARAKRLEELQSTSYRTGTYVFKGSAYGRYTQLGDFAYNDAGQTPRQLCSFTASLAHLLSINPSFITGLSEEAAWYISAELAADYERYLRLAAEHNNLQLPEGLEDAA